MRSKVSFKCSQTFIFNGHIWRPTWSGITGWARWRSRTKSRLASNLMFAISPVLLMSKVTSSDLSPFTRTSTTTDVSVWYQSWFIFAGFEGSGLTTEHSGWFWPVTDASLFSLPGRDVVRSTSIGDAVCWSFCDAVCWSFCESAFWSFCNAAFVSAILFSRSILSSQR